MSATDLAPLPEAATAGEPAPAGAASAPQGLPAAPWRPLARLLRWLEQDPARAVAVLGPRARAAAAAMRAARDCGRQRRHAGEASSTPLPLDALRTLADAARQFDARLRARPPGWFAPAPTAVGPALVLQMPALKTWLRESFAQEVARVDGALPAPTAERAREVLMRRCIALGALDDSYLRRHHLLQLLADHGHGQPLLELAQRAAQDWAPPGWAEDWPQVAGLAPDEVAVRALGRALSDVVAPLQAWCSVPKPQAADADPDPAPAPSPAPGPGTAAPAARASRAAPHRARGGAGGSWQPPLQALRRWAGNPRHVLWTAGGAAVAAVGLGLSMHLSGPASARWVTYHDADGTTMSIDPDSIERSGRQLTYRVGIVRRREDSSAVAWFTTDCDTRERRLEAVQHYRGTRFDTAVRREVRGKPVGTWPSGGADVRLLKAACAQS